MLEHENLCTYTHKSVAMTGNSGVVLVPATLRPGLMYTSIFRPYYYSWFCTGHSIAIDLWVHGD